MGDRPRLTLLESLKQSVAETPEQTENVVDLFRERCERGELSSSEIKPLDLLRLVIEDAERKGNVVKCYVTLVSDTTDAFTVTNYRAGLNREEEVAYRQLGLQEAVDRWRFGGD